MIARVILLNGVSSSGKTTLANALQSRSEKTLLHVALDTFISMLPDGRENGDSWFPVQQIECDGIALPRITNGPQGDQLLKAMRAFVAELVSQGINVVVDDVGDATVIEDYRTSLTDADLLVVKVDAPLQVTAERETARGDRLIGLAREQAIHLHDGITYDLELDTGDLDPAECAGRILARIES
ncbi:MAG: AAA family ATPase [Pseudomonadota bacterium]